MVAQSPFSLKGRSILLTGATGHLGVPMAEAILAADADLLLSGRSSEKLENFLSRQAPEVREHCRVFVGDLSTPNGVVALASEIRGRVPMLHGLVNNASNGRVGELRAITADDFMFSAQHDLIAPFMLIKELLPLMETAAAKTGEASIVNVATMYGSVSPYPEVYGDSGLNNPIQYGATKAGLMQMTRYLACHLGGKGIRVNSIAPGPFPNTQIAPAIPNFFETLATKVPMGRVGSPMEAAHPVVFLLSSASSYINGANIPIDGGWTAW
jgi:NAD(P)-dependent dehydrogenase (short-subunit alcohol dehydrogenase family)